MNITALHTVYLSLGSNIGDKVDNLKKAVIAISALDNVYVVLKSLIYQTPPWGNVAQEAFANAAISIKTSLNPEELLGKCLLIEKSFGRTRDLRWGPRIIDIDILIYEGEVRLDKELTLPHPEISNRPFVLIPLYEIAPDLQINGNRIEKMLEIADNKDGISPISSF